MKFSWGVGITLSYVIFITAIVGIVIYAHTIDVNLVSDNYYEQELKHQDLIEKKIRTQNLPNQVETKISAGKIDITFPKIFKPYELSGRINLFRPSDRNKDLTFNINTDSLMTQTIPTLDLSPGVWRVKIDWSAKNVGYYNEKILMIE